TCPPHTTRLRVARRASLLEGGEAPHADSVRELAPREAPGLRLAALLLAAVLGAHDDGERPAAKQRIIDQMAKLLQVPELAVDSPSRGPRFRTWRPYELGELEEPPPPATVARITAASHSAPRRRASSPRARRRGPAA